MASKTRNARSIIRRILTTAIVLALLCDGPAVQAFAPRAQSYYQVRTSSWTRTFASQDNEDVVLYSDEWEDGAPPPPKAAKKSNRWNALSPAVKAKIVKEAQQRAIANKKKNESSNDKKRRELQFCLVLRLFLVMSFG